MCFGPEAQPPEPPRAGWLAGHDRTALVAADGAAPAATVARTTADSAPGVVILPDVRGLHPYYERLALAFAGAGIHAVAIDFYSRTAGTAHRDADFEFAPHRAQVIDAHVVADAAAGAGALRDLGVTRIYALGFCFGGRGALLQAAEPEWSGAVGFYGFPARTGPEGRSPLGDARDGRVRAAVLALYGEEDDKIPAEDREAYAAALTAAGVDHQSAVYPGAGHSFFDRRMHEQTEACADAWRRVLAFIR
jgi:carboxymethylenebutenolidase